MKYVSTRNNHNPITAHEAINLGMVPEGGLFVPESVVDFPKDVFKKLSELSYQELAKVIFSLYLDDYNPEEIDNIVKAAYGDNFASTLVAPVVQLSHDVNILELWHGPTAAFKDMALQALPLFLTHAIKKSGLDKEVVILVATSGDTGKAALEGFRDIPGTKIIVFYPKDGVSQVQKLQMTSTLGDNTFVVDVDGNFDDCQNSVKEIFQNVEYGDKLRENGYLLSSANSINWGRLLPQIVYYFYGYGQMVKNGQIKLGDKINIVVPTGNFGNILAAYYGKLMGLPVKELICASNKNKVLTDLLNTGVYNRNREFYKTNSPSMDILISSNFERFLYLLNGCNGDEVRKSFEALSKDGKFNIAPDVFASMQANMKGYYADEEATLSSIKSVYDQEKYLMDTHTAVAYNVLGQYRKESGDKTPALVASTANPYKFNSAVLSAVKGADSIVDKDEFTISDELCEITGMPIHNGLVGLKDREVRHNRSIKVADMEDAIFDILAVK